MYFVDHPCVRKRDVLSVINLSMKSGIKLDTYVIFVESAQPLLIEVFMMILHAILDFAKNVTVIFLQSQITHSNRRILINAIMTINLTFNYLRLTNKYVQTVKSSNFAQRNVFHALNLTVWSAKQV